MRQAAVYGGLDLLSRAGALLLVPRYARALGPEEYGILEMPVVTQALGVLLATLGVPSALVMFHILSEGEEERRRYFDAAVWRALLWGTTLAVIAGATPAPWAAWLPPAAREAGLWRAVLLALVLDAVGTVAVALLRAQGKSSR